MDWIDPKPAPRPLALVQDFVNTASRYHEHDALTTPQQATIALAAIGLLETNDQLEEPDRQRLVAVREALRGLLLAHNDSAGHEADAHAWTLDELVRMVPIGVRFSPAGQPTLQPPVNGTPVDRAIGRLLAVIAAADADGYWQRLKACRSESCRWAFYDASKNRSGRWCDMNVCGVRDKMRTYRLRRSG